MGIRIDEDARQILDTLEGRPRSVKTLVDRLDRPQELIERRLEELRDAGFDIADREGRLVFIDDPGYPAGIARGLEAPFTLECHETIGSTNERGRALGRSGEHDVVVLATRQTGGRGRRGRGWVSPPGGIWVTVIVRPRLPPARWGLLTLAGAVAVVAAVETAGVSARIKWPNDVLVGTRDRKLAGILTISGRNPAGDPWVGVGIGLNADVDPASLPAGAASLRPIVNRVDRCRLGRALLETFDSIRDNPADILSRWRTAAVTIGRQVRVETPNGPVVGRAEAVDETGALRVATEAGVELVPVGDCEHLRPA